METNLPANRQKLHDALAQLKQQLSAVRKITDGSMKTSGKFKFNPNVPSVSVDIHTCTDVKELIMVHSFLAAKQSGYVESAQILGLTSFPVFNWQGFSMEDWTSDLKIRVAKVSQHSLATELQKDIATLEQFMEKEDRLALALKGIEEKYL